MQDVRNSNSIGIDAEKAVSNFLCAMGLKVLAHNFRCRFGEIDIIMQDRDCDIVFIEVRVRDNKNFGTAIESVNSLKQKKISQTAVYYLQQKKLLDKVDSRFDIIGVSYENNRPIFEWIKDAFTVEFYL